MAAETDDEYLEAVRTLIRHFFGQQNYDAEVIGAALELIGTRQQFGFLGWATFLAMAEAFTATQEARRAALLALIAKMPKPPLH